MDVFDIFFKKFAYKFPKGYPDMNNVQDVLLLESIFEKLGIDLELEEAKEPFEKLSPKAQEVALDISNKLQIPKENMFKDTLNRIVILTDEPRESFMKQFIDLGFKRDVNIGGSTKGGLKSPEGIEIIFKPLSKQGHKSSGKENERSFESLINSKVEENKGKPITVILKSPSTTTPNPDGGEPLENEGKTIEIPNVSKAEDVSLENATEFAKADVQLLNISENNTTKVLANISLKKRNAIRWESSKTRLIGGINIFKSFIDKVGKIGTDDEVGSFKNVVLYPLEKKGKYKLYNPITKEKLSKVVITNIPEDVWRMVIFGKDEPKTIVIKEDFEGGYSNYTFENKILTLNCHVIYTSASDVQNTYDEPVFALSNHIGQSYGVEFRSFSKGALYDDKDLKGSSVEIDFNKLK